MAEVLQSEQGGIRAKVASERLRLVYEQTPRSIPLSLLVITLMGLLGAQSAPPWSVTLWWVMMIVLVVLRYVSVLAYRRNVGKTQHESYWSYVCFYGVLATGLGWGCGGILLALEASTEYQLIVLMILAGIAGGALPFLAIHLASFIGFILALTLPNLAWLMWQGGNIEILSGVLLCVYMVALWFNAYRLHQLMEETLALRFENEAMAQSLQHEKDELEAMNSELERLSHVDGLTQLANRRYFDLRYKEQWQRGMREDASVAVLMLDIDEFKKYNDTYGHTVGDDCLRTIAATISNALLRPSDLAARYGGEEFVVLLANTDLEGATNVANEIVERTRELRIPHRTSSVANYLTVSIGVATVVPHHDIPRAYLIEAADLALYKSKHAGRDQVTISDVSAPGSAASEDVTGTA